MRSTDRGLDIAGLGLDRDSTSESKVRRSRICFMFKPWPVSSVEKIHIFHLPFRRKLIKASLLQSTRICLDVLVCLAFIWTTYTRASSVYLQIVADPFQFCRKWKETFGWRKKPNWSYGHAWGTAVANLQSTPSKKEIYLFHNKR